MRFGIPEEEKRMIEKIKPWVGHHAQLKDDAPQEIKDMQKELIRIGEERRKLAYS